ncbi:transglycosylase family protein [Serinicoccus chungangensis]|uniref:transglycosylase family protein n=1 Tax=Serinicoccus chungangensis TaxID=767452 RepID=UPI001118C609|nr:transglycosylase family protein [Serinicoccus chungangensis]
MARHARHRAARTGAALRRAGQATLAGTASLASVGLTAQGAAADDHNVWDRVAACESSGNWSINSGNGFYGGLQFWHPTWKGFGGQEFAGYAHQASKAEQITVAQRVLRVQGPGAWPVCSVRAGLTMQNGLEPYGGGSSPAPSPAPAPDPEPQPDPTPPPGAATTWTVTAGAGANIRSGPGTSYGVIGGAAKGTRFQGAASNGWVKLEGRSGWISASIMSPGGDNGGGGGGGGGGSASDMAPLVTDGIRGPLTTKAVQRWVGVAETGAWDTRTIKAVQAKVGTGVDGVWGPKSQAALQNYIGVSRDGSTYMNHRTVVGLQKWLNSNVIG